MLFFTVIKIDHEKVLFSESSVFQIYFKLASIWKIEIVIFKVLLYDNTQLKQILCVKLK